MCERNDEKPEKRDAVLEGPGYEEARFGQTDVLISSDLARRIRLERARRDRVAGQDGESA